MPSPSITRSSSEPTISKPNHSRSHSLSSAPPSNASPCSTGLQKPANWSKKVGNLITRKSTKKNSDLTEESLEEFNIINAILYDHKKSSFTYSPYYKGLTDSSLALSRQKLSAASPGRESNVSSLSSNSRSSFGVMVKMKKLGSCFTSFGMEGHNRSRRAQAPSSSSSASTMKITTLAKELGLDGKLVTIGLKGSEEILLVKGKPLRERDSEPQTQSPSSLPPVSPSPQASLPSVSARWKANPSPLSPPPTPLPPSLQETHPSPPPSSLPTISPPLEAHPSSPPVTPPPLAHQSLPPSSPPQHTFASSPQSFLTSSPSPPQVHPSLPAPLPPIPSPPQAKPSASPSSSTQSSPQQLLLPPPPPPLSSSPPHPAQISPQQSPMQPLPSLLPPSPTLEAQTSPANRPTMNGRVYAWADKYRPEDLEDFICHRNKALELRALAKADDSCDHFIFEGPTGVGKRTMIGALLREVYGSDRVKAREECKHFPLKGEAVGSIKVTVKISLQHVEVNLSEVKGYEKQVIVELIQETINRLAKQSMHCNKDNCQVIILNEADKLSADALLYIKWQLERQRGCSKVFFCCTDASKLQPIMSLCTVVKLFPPSNVEIVKVLKFIAKQEGIELPHQFAEKIANNSKNNLRQAIRSFEATWQASSTLMEDQELLTGWEDDIAKIAKNIVEEQSPKQLYVIRGKLQNLIQHNVCPEFIFEELVGELKQHLDEEFQAQLGRIYEDYKNLAGNQHEEMVKRHNDPMKRNIHQFMRIEEFIAKFMSCYKMAIVKKKDM